MVMVPWLYQAMEGLVLSLNWMISSNENAQLWLKVKTQNIPNWKLGIIKQAGFPIHGAKLLNVLPKYLRELTNVRIEVLKQALDMFLKQELDELQLPGFTAQRRVSSNSLFDMTNTTNNQVGACSVP